MYPTLENLSMYFPSEGALSLNFPLSPEVAPVTYVLSAVSICIVTCARVSLVSRSVSTPVMLRSWAYITVHASENSIIITVFFILCV